MVPTDERHPTIARAGKSLLVLIDCQERLWKVIAGKDALEARMKILLRGAALIGVPVVVTEQNPGGLGPTIPSLRDACPDARVLAKQTFSCCGDPGFREALRATDREQIVLAGIEAHICVLQTALDALALGYDVHIVSDAAGTRLPHNLEPGLRRAERAGAVITTVESVLFEWMERCDAPVFRDVVQLLK